MERILLVSLCGSYLLFSGSMLMALLRAARRLNRDWEDQRCSAATRPSPLIAFSEQSTSSPKQRDN
jgi:hypothetical protein